MLIPSDRHAAKDLELWRALEASDQVHALRDGFRRRVERSLAVLEEFCAAGPCYCGVSWGKDSVATAHLLHRVAPDVPLCWVRVEPIRNPDCAAVRDAYLRRFPCTPYHEVEVWCRRGERDWHASGTLERGFAEARRLTGADRYILGLRADESGSRALSLRSRGEETAVSCRPLGWWTSQDVYGYLASEDLPVHPAYGMTGGGRWPRDHLRVSSLGGRRGTGHGRDAWEREYYGDCLRRLEAGIRAAARPH